MRMNHIITTHSQYMPNERGRLLSKIEEIYLGGGNIYLKPAIFRKVIIIPQVNYHS